MDKTTVSLKPGDRGWSFTVSLYSASQLVSIQAGCFAIMVTNTGADIVRVNGIILYPGTVGTNLGDAKAIGGHNGNILLQGILKVAFQTTVAPELEIIQTYYTDYKS